MTSSLTTTSSPNFKKAETTWEAIKDLDRILSTQSQEKLDETMHALADIDKTEFSIEDQNKIVSSIRSCLVKIYREAMTSINNDIGLTEVNIRGIDNM
jgi:hypothetical protein